MHGVSDMGVEGHIAGSSSRICSLFYCMAVRVGHLKVTKRRLDAFGNKCLCEFMGHWWNKSVSNQRLLGVSESRLVARREHQLWLY